jgi:hypothetical protein
MRTNISSAASVQPMAAHRPAKTNQMMLSSSRIGRPYPFASGVALTITHAGHGFTSAFGVGS